MAWCLKQFICSFPVSAFLELKYQLPGWIGLALRVILRSRVTKTVEGRGWWFLILPNCGDSLSWSSNPLGSQEDCVGQQIPECFPRWWENLERIGVPKCCGGGFVVSSKECLPLLSMSNNNTSRISSVNCSIYWASAMKTSGNIIFWKKKLKFREVKYHAGIWT